MIGGARPLVSICVQSSQAALSDLSPLHITWRRHQAKALRQDVALRTSDHATTIQPDDGVQGGRPPTGTKFSRGQL